MDTPVELVQALVSSHFFLGDARSAGGLTLVPVLGAERGKPGYILAADAFAESTLTISEIGLPATRPLGQRGADCILADSQGAKE